MRIPSTFIHARIEMNLVETICFRVINHPIQQLRSVPFSSCFRQCRQIIDINVFTPKEVVSPFKHKSRNSFSTFFHKNEFAIVIKRFSDGIVIMLFE